MTLVLDPPPVGSAARPGEEASGVFRFAAGVLESLRAFGGRCTVVRLSTLDNETLGVPRWYTLAEAWCDADSVVAATWSQNPVVEVGPADDPELVLAHSTPVVVLGAANATTGWARSVIDSVRASCRSVVVVDLEAERPSDYADIAATGHDRGRGGALLALLSGR